MAIEAPQRKQEDAPFGRVALINPEQSFKVSKKVSVYPLFMACYEL